MCDGVYRKLQEYYEAQEWELTKLALALNSRGWYAAVTWDRGKLMLVVRSHKSMRKWRQRKLEVVA
jgi:hypothetical protein